LVEVVLGDAECAIVAMLAVVAVAGPPDVGSSVV
jgi:hypothetical protein